MEIERGGQTLVGYPALVDAGRRGRRCRCSTRRRRRASCIAPACGGCSPSLFATASRDLRDDLARDVKLARHRRRRDRRRARRARFSPDAAPIAAADFARRGRGGPQPLRPDRAGDRAHRGAASSPSTRRCRRSSPRWRRASRRPASDVKQQLERLLAPGWLARTPWERAAAPAALPQGGIAAPGQAARRSARDARLRRRGGERSRRRYRREAAARARYGRRPAELEQFGWLLEELRVSLFAQELKTPVPVSAKRLGQTLADSAADETRSSARSRYAAANLLHPRMLWLMVWPMLVAARVLGHRRAVPLGARIALRLADAVPAAGLEFVHLQLDLTRRTDRGARGAVPAVRAAGLPDGALHPRHLRHAARWSSTSPPRSFPALERRRGGGVVGDLRTASRRSIGMAGARPSSRCRLWLAAAALAADPARASSPGRTSGCCATTRSPSTPTAQEMRADLPPAARRTLYLLGAAVGAARLRAGRRLRRAGAVRPRVHPLSARRSGGA